ncbi:MULTISPECIES: SURF1 family protein [unclassified Plantibacter]|jgi:surfeit locus 1 family protein|uniref:SURF1 family protein n=1 Tax=unclassified Plantibacter TaxID=2624265 RepID=UPI0009E88687|nr:MULTISPECIES: SURF1 family cytochrome oxidase biogenesis protein [unclassified Plantibacter]
MLRPRWIGVLVLCLAVAGAFAALGQWQLARAIESGQVVPSETESVRPLADVLEPGVGIREVDAGQRISVTGTWVPGDYLVVGDRVNDGVLGYWVTGHLATDRPDAAGLAVAVGWTKDRQVADRVADALNADAPSGVVELEGRLNPPEGPEEPASDAAPTDLDNMSVAALLNRWSDADGLRVFTAFLVDDDAADGLETISSPAPSQEIQLNWLNIFYAAEWVVFACFAVFLWYRLAKDAWEREIEELEDAEEQASQPTA